MVWEREEPAVGRQIWVFLLCVCVLSVFVFDLVRCNMLAASIKHYKNHRKNQHNTLGHDVGAKLQSLQCWM